MRYRTDFDQIPWQVPMTGVRHKCSDQNGIRLRLVEYSKGMPAHWCEKGHYGYLIEGKMEVEFDNSKETYSEGDGIFLPNGTEHKHKARMITDRVTVFFVESI